MTSFQFQIRLRDPAARCVRVVHVSFAREGVGNAGRPMHPQPRVRNRIKHTSVVTTVTPEITRHSPRNGFTAYFALSPATNSSCHRRCRISGWSNPVGPDAPPTAWHQQRVSEPHDLAVRVSAVRLRAIRQLTGLVDPPCHPLTSPDAIASTASRPALMTLRNAPLSGRDSDGFRSDLGQARRKIFLQRGLDRGLAETARRANQIDPVQQIRLP